MDLCVGTLNFTCAEPELVNPGVCDLRRNLCQIWVQDPSPDWCLDQQKTFDRVVIHICFPN